MILNGLPWKQTDYSVVFEIASKYCISDPFVDYHGYSIFSKVLLPTVVDIMVLIFYFIYFLKYKFIYFNWRLITLQYCIGYNIVLYWFCHTSI